MQNIIYFNNEFIPSQQATLHPADRGLLFGDGLFETMRIYKGAALLLKRHWHRFIQGARILEIPVPVSIVASEMLNQIILQLLNANDYAGQDAIVRLSVTRGHGVREIFPAQPLTPTVLMTLAPYQPAQKSAITAHISSIHRNEKSPLAQVKSLNYLDNILARREANLMGADEAILLNSVGNVAEAATANIFMVKDKQIKTPKISEGALPGVMRQIVLEAAAKAQMLITEEVITVEELMHAEEIFVTNAVLGIMPVEQVNAQRIGHSLTFTTVLALQNLISTSLCT
jgi:aminodeoxychorismate lyase